jgi:hypothetical protein
MNYILHFLLNGPEIDKVSLKAVPDTIDKNNPHPKLAIVGFPVKLHSIFGRSFAATLVEHALGQVNTNSAGSYQMTGEVALTESSRGIFNTTHPPCTIDWQLIEQPYSIAKLKTWNTHDGGGYQGDIIKNGKTVGNFHNDGNGGCTMIDFWQMQGKKVVGRNRDEEDAFNAFVKTLPNVGTDLPGIRDTSEPFILEMDGDIFIGELVSDLEEKRFFKRKCAKSTWFRLEDAAPGSWMVLNTPFSEKVQEQLESKYGNKLLEIANLTRL